MAHRHFRTVTSALLIVLGIGTLTYPAASQWQHQLIQSHANEVLADTAKVIGPEGRKEIIDEAKAYNKALYTGIGYEDFTYDDVLDVPPSDVIARLRIPAINLDQPVRHGLGEDVLTRGLGHADISSFPVGGEGSHAVIGGHRGLATTEGFTNLPALKVDDLIYVEILNEVLTYKIIETEVLDPQEASVYPIDPNRDLLSLLTCTPLGVNTHRWVATAERIPTVAEEAAGGEASVLPGFPWWAVYSGAGLLGTIIFVGVSWRKDNKLARARGELPSKARNSTPLPATEISASTAIA